MAISNVWRKWKADGGWSQMGEKYSEYYYDRPECDKQNTN